MERLQKFWLAGVCKKNDAKGESSMPLGILNFTSAFLLLAGGMLLVGLLLLLEHSYFKFLRSRLRKWDQSGCCSLVSLSVGKSLTFEQSVREAIELQKNYKCRNPICETQVWKLKHELDMARLNIDRLQKLIRLRQGQSEHSLLNKTNAKYPNHESVSAKGAAGQTQEEPTATEAKHSKPTKRSSAATQSRQRSPCLGTADPESKSKFKPFPVGNPPKYSEIGSDGRGGGGSPEVARERSEDDMGSSTSIPQSTTVAATNSDLRRAMWRRSRSLPNSLVKMAGGRRKSEEGKGGRRETGNSSGVLCLEQKRLLPATTTRGGSPANSRSQPSLSDARNAQVGGNREGKVRTEMEETTIQIETTL